MIGSKIPRYLLLSLALGVAMGIIMLSMFYGQYRWLADEIMSASAAEHDAAFGQVEITNTARITGTVTGEAIAVAEGAIVEGVMRTTGRSDPQEFVEKREDR